MRWERATPMALFVFHQSLLARKGRASSHSSIVHPMSAIGVARSQR